jgi:DNA-directed RNA polymerase subunit M/transcription elongation factor TFIIS
MAEMYTIACTKCGKQIKVGEAVLGKKIRCKDCQNVFVAQKPAATARTGSAAPPAGQQLSMKEVYEQQIADEEAQGDNPYGMGAVEEGAARCPRCANAMESETAVICLNCGFNVKTRTRAETKAVYEHTGQEVFIHRLPGIICALVAITTLVFGIIFNFKVQVWSKDWEWLQNEDKTFWLKPGIFGLYGSLALIVFVLIPCTRFAIKRLVYNHRPVERVIK